MKLQKEVTYMVKRRYPLFDWDFFGAGAWVGYVIGVAFMAVLTLGCAGDAPTVPDAAPPPDAAAFSEIGGTCELTEDCITGECVTEVAGFEWPGGMCLTPCLWPSSAQCEPTESCMKMESGKPPAYCIALCEVEEDCPREGYGCLALTVWDFRRWCLPEVFRRSWDPAPG